MVATVQIIEKNGNTATPTTAQKDSGTVRFKNAANATVDNNNRLVIPASGREYSYEKWLRFKVTVAPDVDLQNLEAYSDGANGFGTGIKVWYAVDAAFDTPVVPSEANDPPEHDASPMTDLFGATVGAAIDLGAGPHTGTGEKGSHLVLVMEVETNASPGSLTGETLTFAYDET